VIASRYPASTTTRSRTSTSVRTIRTVFIALSPRYP
jgi:hypothetical protein